MTLNWVLLIRGDKFKLTDISLNENDISRLNSLDLSTNELLC